MPTQRLVPRPREPRLHLSCLEQYKLLRTIQSTTALLRLVVGANRAGYTGRKQMLLTLLVSAIGCMCMMVATPRMRDETARQRKGLMDFGEHEFKEHMRFRKEDFLRVLHAMQLTQPGHQAAKWLKVGRHGRHIMVPSDWALMVKKCATTCFAVMASRVPHHVWQ